MDNPTIWVATVDTRYEWTAAAYTADEAITIACEAALNWLRDGGSCRFADADEVREYFGVFATAIPVGTAVRR